MTVTATLRYTTQTEATPSARRYSAMYRCTTTTATDGPIEVRAALPGLGTTHAVVAATLGQGGDPFAVITGYGQITPANFEAGFVTVWDATVNFSTVPDKQQGSCQQTLDQPPWERPARISGGGTEGVIDVSGEKDSAGTRIVNSAGFAFDTPIEVNNSEPMLFIEREYLASGFDISILWDLTYNVNNATFFYQPAGVWRLDPPRWRRQAIGSAANCQEYYTVMYTFRGNLRTWELMPKDEGRFDVNGLNFKIGEHSVNTIRPLDGAGNFILSPAAQDPVHFDGEGNNPAPFKYYPSADFATQLALPSSL